MRHLPRISKKATFSILAVYLLLSLYKSIFDPGGIKDHQHLQKQNHDLRVQIQKIQDVSDSLESVKHRLQNDSIYIEHTLRKQIGMVRPGEEIFIFHKKKVNLHFTFFG